MTRRDIDAGYQLVQSAHAVAQFALDHRDEFQKWDNESKSIICLSTQDEESLKKISDQISALTKVTEFREPDIDDQLTAICFYADYEIRKKLSSLPSALKEFRTKEVQNVSSI